MGPAKSLKPSKALKSTVFRARKVQRDFSLMPSIADSYEAQLVTSHFPMDLQSRQLVAAL